MIENKRFKMVVEACGYKKLWKTNKKIYNELRIATREENGVTYSLKDIDKYYVIEVLYIDEKNRGKGLATKFINSLDKPIIMFPSNDKIKRLITRLGFVTHTTDIFNHTMYGTKHYRVELEWKKFPLGFIYFKGIVQ